MQQHRGFTLVELIVALLIVSVIAGFGFPNFSKTINRAKASDAIKNLGVIHAANMLYRTRTGVFFTAGDINAINSILNLSINANGVNYACTTGTTCVATGPGSVFVATLTFNTPLSGGNPTCPQSVCP